MKIHLLDMGFKKYGDCILVLHGGRSILIDGAHPGDQASIKSQLKTLLGHPAPFEVDLLVVTHAHQDHIGCLPKLVSTGALKAKRALVADEGLGWGETADDGGPIDAVESDAVRAAVALFREEDYSDLPDDELAEVLADVATLKEQYEGMLTTLDDDGTDIVRYTGLDDPAAVQAIEAEFADFGLKVLGPTTDHLLLCTEAINQALQDAVAAAGEDAAADASPVALYRRLARRGVPEGADPADAPSRPGPALNNQSIVLKFAAGGWSALLAGDMQFAVPQVADLGDMMTALRQTVADAGPYQFIKFTHHTSFNAVDESVLDEWADTRLFAHTGGLNDDSHPEPEVLELLESRQEQFKFARTDRNGIITVAKTGSTVKMTVQKGTLNNFEPNVEQDIDEEPGEGPEPEPPARQIAAAGAADGVVEVVARVPHTATTVTLTIRVEPGEKKNGVTAGDGRVGAGGAPLTPGGGRALPRLLFVTCRPKLEQNIGREEAGRVLDALAASGGLVDLPPDLTAERAAGLVRPELRRGGYVGVVLVGGYDVVPPYRLDVLDDATRREVDARGEVSRDLDGFFVWSDELYGDRDGDFLPEVPVSRVPDGRHPEVVFGALGARPFAPGRRFAVGNLKRPFAAEVFRAVPGAGNLEVSEAFAPEVCPPNAAAGAVYLMLHGDARDATRFWGETARGVLFDGFGVENVPSSAAGSVVFSGCCWGALAMGPPAARARPETPLRPRGPEASIPVAYLRAGALAFVGCTGTHYSPGEAPFAYFGRPMHDAFWAEIARGRAPADALFRAKKEYLRGMPHGQTAPFARAVEFKILRQFTCLGLGW